MMGCSYYAVKRAIVRDNVLNSFGNPIPVEQPFCKFPGNAAQENRDSGAIGALTCWGSVDNCELPQGAPIDATELK